jgi:hypothetical protein
MKNNIYNLLANANENIFCLQVHKSLYTEFSLFQNQLRDILQYYHVLPESITTWTFEKGIFIPQFNGEIMINSFGYGYGDAGHFYALVDKYQLALFINLFFWESKRDLYNELGHDLDRNICSSVVGYLEEYAVDQRVNLTDCIIDN